VRMPEGSEFVKRSFDIRRVARPTTTLPGIWKTCGHIAAAARTDFSGQKSDQRQPRPLSKPEWLKKLSLGVFNRGADGVGS